MNAVTEATREDFFDLVADGVVLVDVWGPLCQRCLALLPHVEALPDRFPELRIVKLEAPKARRVCMELKLLGLPSFLLFDGGTEVGRLTHPELTADQVDTWLDELMAHTPGAQGGESC